MQIRNLKWDIDAWEDYLYWQKLPVLAKAG